MPHCVEDIETWSTTNVGRDALQQGHATRHNFRFIIVPTTVSYPDYPDLDETVDQDRNTVRANFNGDLEPPDILTDRNGDRIYPSWNFSINNPTTVRLLDQWLIFVSCVNGTRRTETVWANGEDFPLEKLANYGLGQFANNDLTTKRLKVNWV